ncbi:hypothetical protein [Methanosarcina sp.]|uniref:hypothetical protein n=1 Tax=Methanosarcina sp. TaxID=2213 RepID=UPI00064E3FB2|nr:hypothetical protein [Methanosarcina sp.]MDW5549117.1 hypothetical protein [Methanosarcina sp.]MDW5549146.1 hypothetical protein [Methanosarcina sp.]MDW5553149.1 hypothetical protein [Methanosarcina sp.]MDW5559325.1 hypothetical protein [Methanosarcina sp.]
MEYFYTKKRIKIAGALAIYTRKIQFKELPRPLGPVCGEYLQVCYKRKLIEGKRVLVPVGLVCDSETCEYITKT